VLKQREGYESIKLAAKRFAEALTFLSFSKPPEQLPKSKPSLFSITLDDLFRSFYALAPSELGDWKSESVKKAMPAPLGVAVSLKAAEILAFIGERGSATPEDIFSLSKTRSELVAAFLAVLELIREDRLTFADGLLTLAAVR
jgi:chromatin segregation and condensation protein Rec8/ScpA/Scc1 (kleisin family)